MLNDTERKRVRQQASSQLLDGTVASPAVDEDGYLQVELDAGRGVVHKCPWTAPPPELPQPEPGDGAAVMESDFGNFWVLAWWPNG